MLRRRVVPEPLRWLLFRLPIWRLWFVIAFVVLGWIIANGRELLR